MKKVRAFLKWAGGKHSLIEAIHQHLPQGERLVEPFVGAGSVFLNTDYQRYLLADVNQDLIALYQIVQQESERYIADAKSLFVPKNNDKQRYYQFREKFNKSKDPYLRSLLFLYLNRHGFNGLCRYNKKGIFNVPFGSYSKPYFPEAELNFFAEKSQRAEFVCCSYDETFAKVQGNDVVYCDPPYAPLSTTACFTTYASYGFSLDDQAVLARLARHTAREKGIPVLISNHDIPLTRELYRGANLGSIQVKRSISRNGNQRKKVDELLALYRSEDS
ncbi:Dam family site-specific DNA-(adenine-N6)-methyltransferase [Dongshaea marina]|uniref:Dam family site-specific DNA-(adenine-N6)-methyltransferase n=1 Tax=Dongshaea marina TaxID=2047966 RepID=UPI0018FF9631|nr:Dam family site-specific DNA-(adenine-N6)-methyltransferase [Dongshaea marina]